MQIETARKMQEGEIRPEIGENCTLGEALQLAMGACLTDEGDIFCLECNKPNECCTCGENQDEQYY